MMTSGLIAILIHILIVILVIGVIFWLIWYYALPNLPMPAPFNQLVRFIVILIFVLILIGLLWPLLAVR